SNESSPTNTGELTYTGLRFLRNAVLLQATNRVYDPRSCKWIQIDPLGFDAGDTDLSRYVHNGPTNGADPDGLRLITQDRATAEALDAWIQQQMRELTARPDGDVYNEAVGSTGLWRVGGSGQDGNIALAEQNGRTQLVELLRAFPGNTPDLLVTRNAD